MRPIIYVDLRCLQDHNYRHRGIGHHTSGLLRARRHSALSGNRIIGLIDPRYPALESNFETLVDEVTASVNPRFDNEPLIYIDPSPMTHAATFSLRFQNHPGFFGACVLYDFIPWDWPGYLPTVAHRIEYLSRLARLRSFDRLYPISEYTARRLRELLCIPHSHISVTGAAVRRSLYEARERVAHTPTPLELAEPYFVTLGGDDRRKNTEAAVRAVQRLNCLSGRRIALKVIGFYSESLPYKNDLLRLSTCNGNDTFLEFYPWIPDEQVVRLHQGALAAIAPSFIEGFCLPIAEAAVCGCPVIAAKCDAQAELVRQPEALFEPTDFVELAEKLDRLIKFPELRAALVKEQSQLAVSFHERQVGLRFWDDVAAASRSRRACGSRSATTKPRISFIGPCLPDPSHTGVYTTRIMEAGLSLFQSEIYTNSARPLSSAHHVRDAGPITAAAFVDRRSTSIISVLGSSAGNGRTLEIFERFGGPCILHDLQILNSWIGEAGVENVRATASQLLKRDISPNELQTWASKDDAPAELFGPILCRAAPLIVNSDGFARLIKSRYGIDAEVASFCPLVSIEAAEVTSAARQEVRHRYGIRPNDLVISMPGAASRENGFEMGILAAELLHSWGVSAEIYLICDSRPFIAEIDRLGRLFNIIDHVHHAQRFATSSAYRDFLIAADVAVHIQTAPSGRTRPAIHDALGAGLPCAASFELAELSGAREYVSTVPDHFSPLLLAEAIMATWEKTSHADRRQRMAEYGKTHNFTFYAKRLTEILGVA